MSDAATAVYNMTLIMMEGWRDRLLALADDPNLVPLTAREALLALAQGMDEGLAKQRGKAP